MHEGPVDSLAFDSNHGRIASTGKGTLHVWDIDKDGKPLIRKYNFHSRNLAGVLKCLRSSPPRPWRAVTVIFFGNGESVMLCYLESHEV